ncbi:unnamed protein product [Peniophora sp. CBMAI 1063]|nr:unnamed protein product [Peniophora sp. CBMAI 1063]
MESLNLNTLASSLPPSSNAATEKALLDDFKVAAASVTKLYRSSLKASKRTYNKGYADACQEILQMIQHGVSDHEDAAVHVGRVMDWLEARLDALKAREEEEDEDEDRGGAGMGAKPASTLVRASSAPAPAALNPSRDSARLVPSKLSQSITSSPPSPPLRPSSSPQIPTTSTSRPIKPRPNTSQRAPDVPIAPDITDMPAPVSIPAPDTFSVSAGAKRRHAMMMMLDQTAPNEPAFLFASELAARYLQVSVPARLDHMLCSSSITRPHVLRPIQSPLP